MIVEIKPVTNEPQLRETITRCVSTMLRYHECGRTRYATDLMIAEVQVHAAWTLEMGLTPGEAIERVLQPVEAELMTRYGHELGARLNAEFLKAFEDFGTFGHMVGSRAVRNGVAPAG